ncbi:MAG: methyltransferase domain-containing protein [Gemmatimonadales bacterium]
MVVITANQRDIIFDAVRAMYTNVATCPAQEFHFPTGRAACEFLDYPRPLLDWLPGTAVESFAGVGYPFAAGVIREGNVVLDIGSGSGTDALLARLLVGERGRVIGLDLTDAMREKFIGTVRALGITNLECAGGNAELIPLRDASVDVVTSNGVLNLVPDKPRAIGDMYRVLRPGGRVQIADIVVGTLPSDACRGQPQLWAECIVGATTERAYIDNFLAAGFSDLEVLSHLDYFARSPSAETRKVARSFAARAIVLRALKTHVEGSQPIAN